MKPITNAVVGFCLIVSGLGCQCYGLTERYADFVDDVSDHKPNLDRFYSAKYDLNRIGKPDWCQSRINCWLCGRACCEAAMCRYCQTESNPSHELSPPPAPAFNPTPEQPELKQPTPKVSAPEKTTPKPYSTQEEGRPKSPNRSDSLQFLPPILLESEAELKNTDRRK
jgi:hypothetical protein